MFEKMEYLLLSLLFLFFLQIMHPKLQRKIFLYRVKQTHKY